MWEMATVVSQTLCWRLKDNFVRDESVRRHFPVVQTEASPSAPIHPPVCKETVLENHSFFLLLSFLRMRLHSAPSGLKIHTGLICQQKEKQDKTSQHSFHNDEAAPPCRCKRLRREKFTQAAPPKKWQKENSVIFPEPPQCSQHLSKDSSTEL